MTLIDITPRVSPSLAVWPGDTPASREIILDQSRGDSVTLSTLRATVHLGAHADAPNHYGLHAAAIHERPLHYYIGPCALFHVDVAPRTRITIADFLAAARRAGWRENAAGALHGPDAAPLPPRILLSTGTFPDPNRWEPGFAALSPELVDDLHARGVILIGIDTPSVDIVDDRQLLAHKRFLAHDMAILEGIVIRDVPAGVYELIAPPLALEGFDGSPVRALLRRTPATANQT
ncbi:MAG: cyclase family protein [Phycisphaerae bacterium]|nr:cyclase family protein [Phycisphaerae bacterium]